ncbi:DDHD domain-containing protein [Auriculariales sp. MPI-PUGE-AT-0066]|nr:DDHD domain-containing protein [Auriculariales sp. MPI-PUGE-AT-0066]
MSNVASRVSLVQSISVVPPAQQRFMAQYIDHVPKYPIRWLRPAYSTALLDLPTAPIDQSAADTWRAFTEDESATCEEAWQRLPVDQRLESGENVIAPKETSDDAHHEDDREEDAVGVAIYKIAFMRTMHLKPVYWRLTGKPVPVMRAHWMYDEHRPVPEPLNSRLEKAYRKSKPWLAAYAEELRAVLTAGVEAHEKLKVPLESEEENLSVVFQDSGSGRIISDNLAFRVQQSLYSSFMSNTARPIAFPGATPVYRGYDVAAKATGTAATVSSKPSSGTATPTHGRSASLGPKDDVKSTSKSHTRKGSKLAQNDEERELVHTDVPSKTGEEKEGDAITDLVFIVHGIGQNLAVQYETLNFTYATNLFRQVARKQSALPELSEIMRSRRIQFLPLQWRASFGLSMEEAQARDEEGLDNRFSLTDITLTESIPFIRELANNVLLDVPYFMSSHKESMISAVCTEANAIYIKWCKRNPGFETNGRVHIIAHSLGSALVTNVLSNQPTHVVPLPKRTDLAPKNEFIFDTSSYFMAGSPLSVFMLLEQRQLIARKGRARTGSSKPDEALDRQGVFGCLSVDAIYNVFYPSDPVAYRINPVVDQRRARRLPPSAITAINASFFSAFSKYFTLPALPAMTLPTMSLPSLSNFKLPFRSAAPTTTVLAAVDAAKTDAVIGTSPPIIKTAPPTNTLEEKPASRRGSTTSTQKLEKAKIFNTQGLTLAEARQLEIPDAMDDRAKRRFEALNPHGTLDFYLPAEGAFSEYIDMVTAHASYWSDTTFASFILAEIFAKQEDRAAADVFTPRVE